MQRWSEPWWDELMTYHMPDAPAIDKLTFEELKALGYIK